MHKLDTFVAVASFGRLGVVAGEQFRRPAGTNVVGGWGWDGGSIQWRGRVPVVAGRLGDCPGRHLAEGVPSASNPNCGVTY